MRTNSSHNSQHSSREHTPISKSRSPTPSVSPTSRKNQNVSKFAVFKVSNYFVDIFDIIYIIVLLFFTGLITAALSPPSHFCDSVVTDDCVPCPEDAVCSSNSEIIKCPHGTSQFYQICHKPGNVTKLYLNESPENLYDKLRDLRFKLAADSKKGEIGVSEIVNSPNNDFDQDDIEILMRFDNKFLIIDGKLVFCSLDAALINFYLFIIIIISVAFAGYKYYNFYHQKKANNKKKQE
ncbi:hypothetical protein TRFO_29138 [Tritrichomonas foetus]|uniref:Man1/Src1 C-terminal domain-containing protein n=1 Tax=Tritrichomonas foetus TaxID=1144522 RepID=A0A1J4JWG2_9EUKA|nr:hypothetical protein TRFO_29138 [Tritrichomonas foetus]|eukprot:OHT03479.1 hypothetical protein TRFO_29138 [Tritrichomonas foetus]